MTAVFRLPFRSGGPPAGGSSGRSQAANRATLPNPNARPSSPAAAPDPKGLELQERQPEREEQAGDEQRQEHVVDGAGVRGPGHEAAHLPLRLHLEVQQRHHRAHHPEAHVHVRHATHLRRGGTPGLCLKGRGCDRGKLQSGCRAVTGDVKRSGGGYWRLEMRLGLVLGYGDAFGVESGPECWGGGGYPPPFKQFPGARAMRDADVWGLSTAVGTGPSSPAGV